MTVEHCVPSLPPNYDRVFSVEELARCNGEAGSDGQIYVAVKGVVFDVSSKADVYGPGGSYHVFAGKDASRALGKSSLKAQDVSAEFADLADDERQVLEDWDKYFRKRYNIVGVTAAAAAKKTGELSAAQE